MEDKRCVIRRLTRKAPDYYAHALYALYELDTSIFPQKDQYGLTLIDLAQMQPSAFWMAELDGEFIGYFSAFQYKTTRLLRDLVSQAKSGTLDLPELTSSRYNKLLYRDISPEQAVHLYIDAIAIKKPKDINVTLIEAMRIREELIGAMRSDITHLLKPSICVIAVRPGVAREIEELDLPFHPVGEAVKNRKRYRKLYVYRGQKYGIVDKILDALSRTGISSASIYGTSGQFGAAPEAGIRITFHREY